MSDTPEVKEPNWPVIQGEISRLVDILDESKDPTVREWALNTLNAIYTAFLLPPAPVFVPAGMEFKPGRW